MKVIDGGITAPRGYKAIGIHCGIKAEKKDLAVIFSETPASAAGVFTTNKIKAAPLYVTMENLKDGLLQAVVVNSGNANACTGDKGMEDAREMAKLTALELGIAESLTAVTSTGVIGVNLPMEKVRSGIREALSKLDASGGKEAAEAIMTTDTFAKEIAVEIIIGGKAVRIAGMAKGSGMIHPNMATMLGFVTSDAKISSSCLDVALKAAVEKSFNMVTVDGDTSTNDMVLVLANGKAGNTEIDSTNSDEFKVFYNALEYVCINLAQAIARDGEGASKFVEIQIKNALTFEDAKKIGKSIATSNLCKTAIFGEDANWGRIVAAVGYSGGEFKEEKLVVHIGDELVYENGMPVAFSEDRASKILAKKDIVISVDLQLGEEQAKVWTCDLTYDYVKINGSYRT